MTNQTPIQQHEVDSANEAVVTANQIDRWSAEIQEFFQDTRLRLNRCGNGLRRTTTEDATQTANDRLTFANHLVDTRPVTEPEPSDANPSGASQGLPGTFTESTSPATDPLHRLHEIKQRLAARMQSS